MSKNKLLICGVLILFYVGLILGSVNASYTCKKGRYTFTVSDNQYKKIEYVKTHNDTKNLEMVADFKVKTNKYYDYKKPKYKLKKIKKYKWIYKTVFVGERHYNIKCNSSTYKNSVNIGDYYSSHGWKRCGGYIKKYNGGRDVKYYSKFKKKVKTTATKKVKIGYKKLKLPIYAVIITSTLTNGYVYINKLQVSFVVMPSKNSRDWIYLPKTYDL